MNIKRGDIYFADLRPVVGSEQGGVRPVLIIQNDMGNCHSPTVICAAITSRMNKAKLPTHIALDAGKYHLMKDSVILLERSINRASRRKYAIWMMQFCTVSIMHFASVWHLMCNNVMQTYEEVIH